MTFTLKRQEIVRDFRNRWKILSSIKCYGFCPKASKRCVKAVTTCLQEPSFHIQGGGLWALREGALYRGPGGSQVQPGPQHELGTFSTCLSKCEFCVHGILEWGLCAQAWGLGIKEGPLWDHRGGLLSPRVLWLGHVLSTAWSGLCLVILPGSCHDALGPCKLTPSREF